MIRTTVSFLAIFFFASTTWAQTVEVSSFTEIKTASGLSVHLIKSDVERVEVEMGKGDFDDLVIEVKNNRLIVKVKSKGFFNVSSTSADIDVYYRQLDELDASSGSSIDSEDELEVVKLDIDVSSGARVELNIDADLLDAEISSGSTLILSGYTDEQKIDISSGASYQGRKLKSKHASVDASSGSSTTVNCTDEIKAEASSGASIKYYGNPKSRLIDPDNWSGGSITAKN